MDHLCPVFKWWTDIRRVTAKMLHNRTLPYTAAGCGDEGNDVNARQLLLWDSLKWSCKRIETKNDIFRTITLLCSGDPNAGLPGF